MSVKNKIFLFSLVLAFCLIPLVFLSGMRRRPGDKPSSSPRLRREESFKEPERKGPVSREASVPGREVAVGPETSEAGVGTEEDIPPPPEDWPKGKVWPPENWPPADWSGEGTPPSPREYRGEWPPRHWGHRGGHWGMGWRRGPGMRGGHRWMHRRHGFQGEGPERFGPGRPHGPGMMPPPGRDFGPGGPGERPPEFMGRPEHVRHHGRYMGGCPLPPPPGWVGPWPPENWPPDSWDGSWPPPKPEGLVGKWPPEGWPGEKPEGWAGQWPPTSWSREGPGFGRFGPGGPGPFGGPHMRHMRPGGPGPEGRGGPGPEGHPGPGGRGMHGHHRR